MKTKINLLPEKAKLKFAAAEKLKKANFGLMTLAIAFFLFLASVLAYNLRLKKENLALKLQIKAAEENIEKNRQSELQAFLLKKRVAEITKILKKRGNFAQKWWEMTEFFPPGSKIQLAEITDQEIKVDLVLPNYQEASNFLDNFPKSKIKELGGKEMVFSSIIRKEEGDYQVSFEVILTNGKPKD